MKAVRILVVCCLVTTFSGGVAQAQKKGSQPDVFLVTIDTLRADHVRCYGYENIQIPATRHAGQEGIRFAQAFTPSPITNTSHTKILAGLLPSHHGVNDFAIPLAESHVHLGGTPVTTFPNPRYELPLGACGASRGGRRPARLMRNAQVATTMDVYGNALMDSKA